jgi:hypothetical protein
MPVSGSGGDPQRFKAAIDLTAFYGTPEGMP